MAGIYLQVLGLFISLLGEPVRLRELSYLVCTQGFNVHLLTVFNRMSGISRRSSRFAVRRQVLIFGNVDSAERLLHLL